MKRTDASRPVSLHLWLALLALFGFGIESAFAQNGTIRGYVTSRETGRPLPGANVIARDSTGTVHGSATDEKGFYQISGLPLGRYHLRVSHVGYAPFRDTVSVHTAGARTRDVALRSAEKQLRGVEVQARSSIAEVEAGRQQVEAADIERIPMPGPSGDLASFLRTEPGVAVLGDRGGRVYVRGGTPSQNLTLVDGTPIYRPFHLLGQYSAFPSELISTADVHAGGFGAEYAGRLSSVIDVRLRPGNKHAYEGSVAASPFLASARFEGPLDPDGRASVVGLFRRSSIESAAPLLIREEVPLYFHDVTVKSHFGGGIDHCSVTALHTYDRGRVDPDDTAASFLWTNNVMSGSCRFLGAQTSSVTDVSVGAAHLLSDVRRSEQSGRSAWRWGIHGGIDYTRPVPWGKVRLGLRFRNDALHYNLDEKFFLRRDEESFGLTFGGHVGIVWEMTSAVTLTPGVAVLAPLSWGHESLEPRLQLTWEPRDARFGTLSAAFGLYHQPIEAIRDVRDAGAAFTAWVPAPVDNQLARATHALLGWSHQFTPGLTVSAEGYFKRMSNLAVSEWSTAARFTTSLALANGVAYGTDLRMEWRHAPLYLTLGYGYGWVEYRASHGDLGTWIQGQGIERYHPAHDRRHKLSVTASLDLALADFDLTWQYGSGRPFTQAFGVDSALNIIGVEESPNQNLGVPRILYRRPYQARLPPYHRLDISARQSVSLSEDVQLTVKLGALNAYNRRNLFYYDLFTLRRVDQLPIVPYLSARFDLQ